MNDKDVRHAGQWLNPLRRLNADVLLNHIWWNGGKIFLDSYHYRCLYEEHHVYRDQVHTAMNDLYNVGALNIHAASSGVVVLTALVHSLDEVLVPPTAAPSPRTNRRRMPAALLACPRTRRGEHG